MRKAINITPKESENIQNLYETYVSYMNVLQFFMDKESTTNQEMLDKKWNEATEINRRLETAQHQVEKKYKPEGDWDRFEFDFERQQVVFIKDGT